jgi:hypothetical protein
MIGCLSPRMVEVKTIYGFPDLEIMDARFQHANPLPGGISTHGIWYGIESLPLPRAHKYYYKT